MIEWLENVPSVFREDRRVCVGGGICERGPRPDVLNFWSGFGGWARFRGEVWLGLEKDFLAFWFPEFCSCFRWFLVWRNVFERPGHWLSLGFRRSHRRERADRPWIRVKV